jgi:hypothetical protein
MLSFQQRTEEFSPCSSYGAILRTLVTHADASTEIDAGYAYRSADYRQERPDNPVVAYRERDWEFNTGIIHARRLAEANTLRVGAQYNHWVCPDGKRFFVGRRMDVETVSGVIMDEQQWERLTLDAGLRITRSFYHDYTDTIFDIAGARLASQAVTDEWGDEVLTGTMGARYRLTDTAALYAHAAIGAVDAPPGAVSETAAGLERETRQVFDAGISLEHPKRGRLEAGTFVTLRQDAVLLTSTMTTATGDDTFNTYANNDVRQYGLELEGRSVPLLEVFSLFGNVTVMDSEKRTAGEWAGYREIPNVIAAAGVSAEWDRFDLNLYGKYVGKYENRRFAEDGQYHPLGDFVDLNLTAGVSLGRERATRVYVALENLLDDEYSTVIGFPDYGFQLFCGLQHEL